MIYSIFDSTRFNNRFNDFIHDPITTNFSKLYPKTVRFVLSAKLFVLHVAVCWVSALDPSVFYMTSFAVNYHKGFWTEAV